MTSSERRTRLDVESDWYQEVLQERSVGVYVKMHRAVFDVLTPFSVEKRRRSARQDRFTDPEWVRLFRELPPRATLDADQVDRLTAVLDEVGPIVVKATQDKGAHFDEAWRRILAVTDGQFPATKERWRTIYNTRLGTSVGEIILATPDLRSSDAGAIVEAAASLLYEPFRDEIAATNADIDWMFVSSHDEALPASAPDPLETLEVLEHRHERALLGLREPRERQWALFRCEAAVDEADTLFRAATGDRDVQLSPDAPGPLAVLLLAMGAGPRRPAPRDAVALVRYVVTLRYPMSWTRLDPDCQAQMVSLLEWLDKQPAQLRSLETRHGSVAADEVRQLVEDKIDRALARDYVRGVRPPPRNHAYWERTLVSARDSVATRPRPGQSLQPMPVTVSSTDQDDGREGSIDPVGAEDVVNDLWLLDIARAAVAHLEAMIDAGQIVLSGDPVVIAGLARWWLVSRAPSLLRGAAAIGPLEDAGSTGPLAAWAERLAAAASKDVTQRAAAGNLVSTPHPGGRSSSDGPRADREAPAAREAAAAAVDALQAALVDWKDDQR